MTASRRLRGPRARAFVARALSITRVERPMRSIVERLFGGCVLAFHDLDADRFCGLVEAMAPGTVVPLDEIVARHRANRSTAGLFAITVDDGVGDTVRALSKVALRKQWPVTFFLPTAYIDTGNGMAFQWLDLLLEVVPRTLVPLPSGPIDLSTDADRARFDTRVRRLAYTRPMQEYEPLLEELKQHAAAAGWLADPHRTTPLPITTSEIAALASHSEIHFESHGVTHTAVCALSPAELDAELRDSRAHIAEWTGRPARHFCYPFGGPESIGTQAPMAVERVYESGVTMSRGRLGRRHAAQLPRIPLYARDTSDVVRLKLLAR